MALEYEVDTVLEKLACDLEKPCFSDMAGIMATRKRVREDAELVAKTRLAQRVELAGRIRSYKSGKGNDIYRLLSDVKNGDAGTHFVWGPAVAAAVLGGLVSVEVKITMETHLGNCPTKFTLALTEEGEKRVLLHTNQSPNEVPTGSENR